MSKQNYQVRPHPKIAKSELEAYLNHELPIDRCKEIETILRISFFYRKVLEEMKAERAINPSAEQEKKPFARLKTCLLEFCKIPVQLFRAEPFITPRFRGFRTGFTM